MSETLEELRVRLDLLFERSERSSHVTPFAFNVECDWPRLSAALAEMHAALEACRGYCGPVDAIVRESFARLDQQEPKS